jgi:predicted phage terminase large subunit-like protein
MQCRDNFWDFCRIAWGLPRSEPDKWAQRAVYMRKLAEWFQFHIDEWMTWREQKRGKQKFLAILVPRELGKSTLITQCGLAWMHLRDPNISTYIGAEKIDFAWDLLAPIKTVFEGGNENSWFDKLYGSWYNKTGLWQRGQFNHILRTNLTKKEPSFGTWGVEAGITGKHPDVLCLDDPISYEKMQSHLNWLETVNNHMTSLIPVLASDGLQILVGTRYGDGDHFGIAVKLEGVKTLSGHKNPEFKPDPLNKWDMFYYSGKIDGRAALPKVWSVQRMNDFERKDARRFAAQVLNDPTSSKYNPLTYAQASQCVIEAKDVPKNLRIVFHVDTAFRDQQRQTGKDDTVLIINGHDRRGNGDVYFLEAHGSNQWRAEDFRDLFISKLQEYRRKGAFPACWTDEPEPGGKAGTWKLIMESAAAAANVPLPRFIPLPRGSKQKVSRLIAAASYVVDGHVYFVKTAPGLDKLLDQMTKIGHSEHDDYADAFSDSFVPAVYQRMVNPFKDTEEMPQQAFDGMLIGNPTVEEIRALRRKDPELVRPPIESFHELYAGTVRNR